MKKIRKKTNSKMMQRVIGQDAKERNTAKSHIRKLMANARKAAEATLTNEPSE